MISWSVRHESGRWPSVIRSSSTYSLYVYHELAFTFIKNALPSTHWHHYWVYFQSTWPCSNCFPSLHSQHLDPLPSLIVKTRLTEDEVYECRTAIFHLMGLEDQGNLPAYSAPRGKKKLVSTIDILICLWCQHKAANRMRSCVSVPVSIKRPQIEVEQVLTSYRRWWNIF